MNGQDELLTCESVIVVVASLAPLSILRSSCCFLVVLFAHGNSGLHIHACVTKATSTKESELRRTRSEARCTYETQPNDKQYIVMSRQLMILLRNAPRCRGYRFACMPNSRRTSGKNDTTLRIARITTHLSQILPRYLKELHYCRLANTSTMLPAKYPQLSSNCSAPHSQILPRYLVELYNCRLGPRVNRATSKLSVHACISVARWL